MSAPRMTACQVQDDLAGAARLYLQDGTALPAESMGESEHGSTKEVKSASLILLRLDAREDRARIMGKSWVCSCESMYADSSHLLFY